jgi:hypothetical protein
MVLKNAFGQNEIFAPEFDESVRGWGTFDALLYMIAGPFEALTHSAEIS